MKTRKLFYGLLAIGPILLFLLGFALPFAAILGTIGLSGGHVEWGMGLFWLFMALQMLVTLLSMACYIASVVMYILHILRNKAMPDDHRIFWILGVVFLVGIAQLVYFVLYISKEDGVPRYPNLKQSKPWE